MRREGEKEVHSIIQSREVSRDGGDEGGHGGKYLSALFVLARPQQTRNSDVCWRKICI